MFLDFLKNIGKNKLLEEKKLSFLRDEYQSILAKASEMSSLSYKIRGEYASERNSKCPKCGSTHVNDRIKRQQGHLEGSMSGEHLLFFGSISGKVEGDWDTNEVNKCNNCKHEWKKETASYRSNSDIIENNLNYVYYYLSEYYDAENCKFNKKDLTEKYNSLEEKKKDLLEKANKGLWVKDILDFWNGYSIDLIKKLAKEKFGDWKYAQWKKCYSEAKLIRIGLVSVEEMIAFPDVFPSSVKKEVS